MYVAINYRPQMMILPIKYPKYEDTGNKRKWKPYFCGGRGVIARPGGFNYEGTTEFTCLTMNTWIIYA